MRFRENPEILKHDHHKSYIQDMFFDMFWWKKSGDHHLGGKKPCKQWDKLPTSPGAGFLPSTVCFDTNPFLIDTGNIFTSLSFPWKMFSTALKLPLSRFLPWFPGARGSLHGVLKEAREKNRWKIAMWVVTKTHPGCLLYMTWLDPRILGGHVLQPLKRSFCLPIPKRSTGHRWTLSNGNNLRLRLVQVPSLQLTASRSWKWIYINGWFGDDPFQLGDSAYFQVCSFWGRVENTDYIWV